VGIRVPPGYIRFRHHDADVVCLEAIADIVREAMQEGTLYAYAAQHPRARALTGRGVAYAVTLPDGNTSVVVRHSRHGGLLAPVTQDRFLPPTRAPHELAVSLRLATTGIPTPEVVAYAIHPAEPFLRRSDVVTREVPRSRDLAVALLGPVDDAARRAMLEATARLLRLLGDAGVRHPDLNLKNVLLAPAGDGGSYEAWLLDLDRVRFGRAGDAAIAEANFSRLARSARKWRDLYGAAIDEADLTALGEAVRAPRA
jgi:Lipopolysaccharide kinase (Kdo/WaaP) family